MPSQGYERVGAEDPDVPTSYSSQPIPNSPPPSFHSRSTSPVSPIRRSNQHEVDRTLAETFDDDSDDDEADDRQRLVRSAAAMEEGRTTNESPSYSYNSQSGTQAQSSRPNTSSAAAAAAAAAAARTNNGDRRFMPSNNDGVFANLNAKPQAGDTAEELPPSYEQAAADATPPYWETTLLAPGMLSDEVYIDGLPVGSFFSFAWNGIIAMAFPLVGFLLTYLLHTTHAARNGSRAGLGVTLINYGFTMKSAGNNGAGPEPGDASPRPANPDEHNFDPNNAAAGVFVDGAAPDSGADTSHSGDWLAYLLMIAGWVILMKAVTDYIKARRHEQLVLQGPERNLPLPVVAEHETAESAV